MNLEKRGSAHTFMGWHTIYEKGDKPGPYMTRIWIGRLRLHIFHRGDLDEDYHDHPWDFWTFPLTSYVEEVVHSHDNPDDRAWTYPKYWKTLQVVPAFHLTFRPATHCHRVLGAYAGYATHPHWGDRVRLQPSEIGTWIPAIANGRKIITIVWRSETKRSWGFLKSRDGRWCWVAWKDYLFGGGKDAPCSDETSK